MPNATKNLTRTCLDWVIKFWTNHADMTTYRSRISWIFNIFSFLLKLVIPLKQGRCWCYFLTIALIIHMYYYLYLIISRRSSIIRNNIYYAPTIDPKNWWGLFLTHLCDEYVSFQSNFEHFEVFLYKTKYTCYIY